MHASTCIPDDEPEEEEAVPDDDPVLPEEEPDDVGPELEELEQPVASPADVADAPMPTTTMT